MTEEIHSFIMDSGAFFDVIPTVLNYLDLKSSIQLSKTCQFWKQRIYNDLKLWSKFMIQLPYIGQIEDNNNKYHNLENVSDLKLWSTVLPPEDPKALEIILGRMASSEESLQRFQLVEKVDFKNYIHTDESLRLTSLLFPSIKAMSFEGNLVTIIGVEYIAKTCHKLKYIEFYECYHLNMPDVFRLFNTEEHKMNLERIFFYTGGFISNNQWFIDSLPFMSVCQRCGLIFNQLKNNNEMLCLYHPEDFSIIGRDYGSYKCCGSSLPNYPSTLGCQYTSHTTIHKPSAFDTPTILIFQNGLPEYIFKKFNSEIPRLQFPDRRLLDQCYEKWNNNKRKEEEE